MKLKAIVSVIALAFASSAFAANDYFPPERINCHLNNLGKLACADFNRQILVEDTFSVDLGNKETPLVFATGAAYFDNGAWQVFYTYKDTHLRMAKLKTVNSNIKPDLSKGAWVKYKDFYTCTAGYMSCPIDSSTVHA